MKAQAFGWLAAGVLAAGLNTNYHTGGLEWAHRISDKVSDNHKAVLALATGNADRLYSQARAARVREANSSCRVSMAMARLQDAMPLRNVAFAQFDRISDRQQVQLARMSARSAQMEARLVRFNLPE